MKPEAYAMLILCGAAIGFVALDRLALWMERRGWIYWRKRKPGEGTGGGPAAGLLTGFQQIIEPRVEYRIQVMEERNESIGQRLGGRRDDVDADAAPEAMQSPGQGSDPEEPGELRRSASAALERLAAEPGPAAPSADLVQTPPK
jgi:hypothetical protein